MTQRPHGFKLTLAAALAAASLWGCGNETPGPTENTGPTVSPSAFQGADETEANLATLATPCTFVADGGVVTISMAAGEYALVGRNTGGTNLMVNGTQCGAATSANTNRVVILGSPDGGNETVILDYLNGSFALGTATVPGVNVDLKAGTTDALKVRASGGVDTFYLATTAPDAGTAGVYALGVGLNGVVPTGIKNVIFNNVESLVVSTGPGADVVYTNGKADAGIGVNPFGKTSSGTGPSLTVYGGEDDDTLNLGVAKGGAVTFYGGTEADAGVGVDTVELGSRTGNFTIAIGSASTCETGETCTFQSDVEVINTGAGNDTLSCAAAVGCTLNGGAGDDTLNGSTAADTLSGGNGNDTIVPGTGADVIVGGAGTDTVSYVGATAAVTVILGADGAITSANGAGGDTSITTCENIIGGDGADTLTGNNLDNVITGGAGVDTMSGGAGNDTFIMAADATLNGDDVIDGEAGEDTVDWSARSADLTLVLTADVASTPNGEGAEATSMVNIENLICGSGDDTVTGDSADNLIEGRAGDDTIDSAGGNDIIDPGLGTNGVTCGSGNDILLPGGTTTAAADCE
jgi:Ca2+-binding RTX toxin-like protein